MKQTTAFTVPVAVVLMLLPLSCTNEYDLSRGEIDKTITLGGEQTALPLLKSGKLRFADFMEEGALQTDVEGNYFISADESFKESFDVADFFQAVSIDGLKAEETINFRVEKGLSLSDAGQEFLSLPLLQGKELWFRFDFEPWRKEGIKSIDAIAFNNLYASLSARLSYLGFADNIKVKAKVRLPERLLLKDASQAEDGAIVLNGFFENGKVEFEPIPIQIMRFNIAQHESFSFADKVVVESFDLLLSPEQACTMEGNATLTITSLICALENGYPVKAIPQKFSGSVERSLGEYSMGPLFIRLPQFLGSDNAVLDLIDAEFSGKVTSSTDIPLKASFIYAASYADGKPISYGQDLEISGSGTTEFAVTGKKMQSMFYKLPQSLSIEASAAIDPDRKLILERDTNPVLEGEFSFKVPLSFGSNMHIEYEKVINKVPDIVSNLLRSNDVILVCEYLNTLPLDLVVTPKFLDVEGREIPICDEHISITGALKSDDPFEAATSITLKKLPSMPDIRQIALHITMGCKRAQGRCINVEDYIQCRAFLRLPDGLTINLD